MASKAFLITIFVAMVAVPSMATRHMVGEDAGWKVGVNYTLWATGKKFYVEDTLMFMYPHGSESVLKVDGPTFQKCVATNTSGVLTSGKDVITLAKPGKKWYNSTVEDHCSKGVKLVITVSEAPAPTPTPLPPQSPGSSGASEISPFKSFVLIVAAVSVFKMIFS